MEFLSQEKIFSNGNYKISFLGTNPIRYNNISMWLKLGESEVINLDFVSTIKKNPDKSSIDIIYHDLNNIKSLPFRSNEDRDRAYKAILENLARMRIFFE